MTLDSPRREQLAGVVNALGAALLFGLSAPMAKMLLAHMGPLLLAGLLYVGAGCGLLVTRWVGRFRRGAPSIDPEAPLRGTDYALLAGIVVTGGIAAPALMTLGLQHVSAVVGSLLLNLEAPVTVGLAVVLFGEHLGGREILGAALIAVAAVLLTDTSGGLHAEAGGAIAIVLACVGWAIDTNLTQRLSGRDPVALVRTKGLAAGTVTTALALAVGSQVPLARYVLGALALGFASYGVSVVLAVRALRLLGAARHAALFATAPFVGALAAVPLLGEAIGAREAAVAGAMMAGLALLLSARHAHWHTHDFLEHEHAHRHDEHHRHDHASSDSPGEPHSHAHRHEPLAHEHPHVSDAHHRHKH